MSVPKAMQDKYNEIAAILEPYCDEYLDAEYKGLCLHALEKLCRKRPSPLLSGRPKTWTAGIVYAIGQTNFIFDKSQPVHMTATEIVEPLGVSTNTASAKATEIRKLLKIDRFSAEWMLPSQVEKNPAVWLVMVNGYMMDARRLPMELQVMCFEKGLIPYVPALKHGAEEQ
ncbi:MAG: hypothetical protein IJT94_17935 [Oscillibacter sp.]|nr:hypothetical protein [Oscillibacter sp.]